jgi:phosphotransferase system enzyme I (PtsI)
VLVASSRLDVAHYYVAARDIDAEVDRLRSARNAVARELTVMKRDLPAEAPPSCRRCSTST